MEISYRFHQVSSFAKMKDWSHGQLHFKTSGLFHNLLRNRTVVWLSTWSFLRPDGGTHSASPDPQTKFTEWERHWGGEEKDLWGEDRGKDGTGTAQFPKTWLRTCIIV
jgi:hypothetical protein